jgi:hypothetical protein
VCKAGCGTGYGDCDGDPTTVIIGVASDPQNCGTCGKLCLTGQCRGRCSGGLRLGAWPGFENCDFDPLNGCEVNLLSNADHCGACGAKCNLLSSIELCQAGVCQIGSCEGTWIDCDKLTASGCEIDIANDSKNCGICGKVCPSSGGTAACTAGACGLSGCTEPFANCNGLPADGCEINNLTPELWRLRHRRNPPNAQSIAQRKCAVVLQRGLYDATVSPPPPADQRQCTNADHWRVRRLRSRTRRPDLRTRRLHHRLQSRL